MVISALMAERMAECQPNPTGHLSLAQTLTGGDDSSGALGYGHADLSHNQVVLGVVRVNLQLIYDPPGVLVVAGLIVAAKEKLNAAEDQMPNWRAQLYLSISEMYLVGKLPRVERESDGKPPKIWLSTTSCSNTRRVNSPK